MIGNKKYDVEIFNLNKIYKLKGKNKKIYALKDVNLKIKKGEIIGLLGPNGAGKTTMVSILSTLLFPTSGYALIGGYNVLKNPKKVRSKIGLMLGSDMLYYRITGYKNLKFFSKIYGIKNYKQKIEELADIFDLKNWLNQYTEKYSTGMKLKLAMIRVLLVDPEILFLDEPMLGLDPKSVKMVIEIFKNLDKTILLTSHQMNVVEKMCDRIAFLNKGEILKIDSKENFKNLIANKIIINLSVRNNTKNLYHKLAGLNFVEKISIDKNQFEIMLESEDFIQELFKVLKDFPITRFNQKSPDLNDVFISLSK